ncbi:unnamed protein product [Prorocentrum cordatum]|uniref:Uncharacterized protein n=1 Tax=Prorocentrum cordatum TaxID=2364126 RepID=A0ABN9W6L5_9DINO|nr:unnamed protein product [Polarella glacialis]
MCKKTSLGKTRGHFTSGRWHQVVQVSESHSPVGDSTSGPSAVIHLKAQRPRIFTIWFIMKTESSSQLGTNTDNLTTRQDTNDRTVQRTACMDIELLYAHNVMF